MATVQQVAQQLPGAGPANGKGDKNGNIAAATASPQQSPSGPVQHRRVYQACIPCRKRKVKCDLGPVDNPRPGPCVRCLRESKACYFSDTRRKQKLDENDEPIYDPDFVDRNARKRTISDRGGSEVPDIRTLGPYRDTPLAPVTPGGRINHYNALPLSRPGHGSRTGSWQQPQVDEDSGRVMTNPEAQSTMRTEIFSNHDAMNLLVKAATDPAENPVGNPNKRAKLDENNMFARARNAQYAGSHNIRRPSLAPQANSSPYRPTYRDGDDFASRQNEPGYQSAVKAWAEFNLVKLKWFTPEEAIGYIDYYYKFLSPLTPISPPTFQNLSTHATLIQDEPVLVVTLLTIASRYYILAPSAGGFARSFDIHDRLWARLRKMVERCLWGQESFGGGSGSTDWEANSSTAPWRGLRRGSLRTLGTVESLMILTEWHPRGLHFPPRDAEYEVVPPSYPVPDEKTNGVGGKKFESWLEPAWRSDRMCWMLLSIAQGLSYELGVFDQTVDDDPSGDRARPEYNEEAYRLRAERIKKLLLIYITQLSGRLGWTNMVTMSEKDSLPLMHLRHRSSMDGNTPGTNSSLINSFNYIPDLELDDQIIHCWAGITSAMRRGNDTIFRSRKYTTDIIRTGKYHALLDNMAPVLASWKKNFDNYQLPHYIRHILTIEYEYVRIYINSLSLQAVVDRSTAQQAMIYDSADADGKYVKEVVEASRNLLRTVVEGLLPNDYLKHAPVRTYFRVISGAMFLLKTFALGASKSDIDVSIGLMDSTVKALRDCVVDDVHLGTRFADLLQTLTSRLRTRFMHVPLGAENAMNTQIQNDQQNLNRENGHEGQGGHNEWEGQQMGYDENTQHFSASAFDLPADSSLYPLFYPLDPTNPPTGIAGINTPNMPSDWAGAGNAGNANAFEQNELGGAYVFPDPRGAEFFSNTQHQEDAYVGEYDWMMEAIPLGVQPEQFRG